MYIVRVKITKTTEASLKHIRELPKATMHGFSGEDALFKFKNEFDAREYAALARSPENHIHAQLEIQGAI